METNITLKLDKTLLREVKILAAEQQSSISRFLTEKLEEIVRERKGFVAARQRAVTRMRNARDLGFTPPASRDELHER